jgi:hypothetical protein
MSLEGRIENGRVVFDEPVPFADGTPVRVEPLPETSARPVRDTSFLERLGNVVGAIHDLPEDLAINHDHYLFGTPKTR